MTLTRERRNGWARERRARLARPTYTIARCRCAPRCYLVLRSLDGGPGESVARFDTERDADTYIRGLPS